MRQGLLRQEWLFYAISWRLGKPPFARPIRASALRSLLLADVLAVAVIGQLWITRPPAYRRRRRPFQGRH